MGPTTWDVNVYIADCSVEEREAQVLNSSIITEQLKSVLSSVTGKTINKNKYKPHQPRFETNKVFVTSISDTDLLTLQPQIIHHSKVNMTIMNDSGATMNFIDDTFVRSNQVPTHPLKSKLRVVLADG